MKTFVLIDVQRDFLPGGALGVPRGDEVISIINCWMAQFERVVATMDWHPKGHVSFASTHGKTVGESIDVQGHSQILWPDHCVQQTADSELAAALKRERIDAIFQKGTDPQVDSYSAFFDQARRRSTGLEEYLRKHRSTQLFFAGLATDYCVLYSVLDALSLGFDVTLIRDGCRAINLNPDDEENALKAMVAHGAKIVESHFHL